MSPIRDWISLSFSLISYVFLTTLHIHFFKAQHLQIGYFHKRSNSSQSFLIVYSKPWLSCYLEPRDLFLSLADTVVGHYYPQISPPVLSRDFLHLSLTRKLQHTLWSWNWESMRPSMSHFSAIAYVKDYLPLDFPHHLKCMRVYLSPSELFELP